MFPITGHTKQGGAAKDAKIDAHHECFACGFHAAGRQEAYALGHHRDELLELLRQLRAEVRGVGQGVDAVDRCSHPLLNLVAGASPGAWGACFLRVL